MHWLILPSIPVRSARDILLLNNTPASQINNRLSLSRAESVALGRPSDMVHLSSSVCVNVPFSGRTVGSGAFVEIGILPCVKVCNRLPRTVHVKRNANVLGVQPTSRLQTMKTTHHRHRVEDSEICAIVASGKEKIVPVMPAELMLSYEGLSSADVVLQRKNVSPDEPLVYSVSLFPPVRARQQSVVETESSQPERKQEALVVNVEVAADSRGEDTKSFFRRLPGPGLFRRVTVFAGYWMVNRLSYPVNLCWSGGKLACPPHQRLLVSTDIVESEKVSISLSRENCDRPPYSERYAKQAQDFGLTHSAEVSSNTFRLCAYNTSVSEPLKIDKSGITPRLSYLANISRAQQPYMRTLGLEIVPACFIHNRKTTPMFIREDPMSRLLDSYKPMGVFPIPPGGSLEFHPQLTTHRLQISGVVEVDRYFSAVMQPHVTARTLYVNKDTQKDEPLWSQAFSVAKPNVFQIRHPAIPVQKYHIGDYSQTWVEVSKNREMRVITLSDPPHAEYRVLNLSSFNLCIGQMEVDGPFEVLLPAKMDPDLRRWLETRDLSSALAPGTAVRDAVDSCALNYNFYAPNEKKKRIFEFWSACPPPPAEDPGKCRLPKDREGVVLPDCRVHWRSLMYWKGLRSHASRFNVDLHFREQKMAKLRGAPPTDRLLPLPTVGGTTINVAVRLFTGAGSRWLVLQDFRRDVMVASELSTRVETLLSDAETSADAVRELLELIRTNSGARCELRRLLALNNSMHDTLLVHLLDEGPTPGDTFSDSGSEDDSKNMDDSREISLIGEKLEFKSHVNRLVTGNSYFNTKIRGVGLSLSEGMNQTELVYLSLAKIVVGVNFAPQEELSLTLSLGWLQIDNSSLVATFPTVLRPIPNAGRIAQNLEEYEPNLLPSQDIPSGFATFTMNVSIRLSSVLDASLIDLPTLQVSVAPLSVSVDYDIIARLLTFADNVISESEFLGVIGTSGNSVALSEVDSESADWLSLLGPAVYLTTQSDAAESVVLSLESVEISELMVVLNVMTEKNWSPKSKKPGRTVSFGKVPMERPEVDCIQSELIKTVLNSISLSPSISDATIVLEKRVDKDLCGSPDQIGMEIALPYITNAAKQTHKVLGSLDLLGNPSAAVRHVERGTMDALMSLKVAFGLERNLTPQQRKRGGCTNCAVGCGGCFTKFLLGIMAAAIDVVSRCCGSWGSNCLNLSLYNDQYSLMSRLPGGINPHESGRTLMEGVWRGGVLCSSLMANSILNTLKGPAACVRCGRDGDESPECAEAASYLCKGCASGVLNLFFGLPASVALLCHHTASGLLSTIVKLPTLLPMRPPRLYLTSSRHQLTTYEFLWSSLADNTHQYLMKSHSYRGSTMENVGASLPLDLEANSLLVFGSEKIGLVRRKKGLIWACPVVEVRTLDLVVEQPRNQCFLRVVTHSESDKKTVYLAPVATISRASLLWSFLVKLIA
ncbi:MAG: uncharacterized protein KVP18_003631 [Porospora cf. gigantea A]|uniref:uncharacterized protein n=1 Tax=Porospora cf. gigantea A TaxID=2853593 RepID=UPI00355A9A6E|nr:MAG: hypothetical protein KVP18_003631 [Porospora cf. gigantea A]